MSNPPSTYQPSDRLDGRVAVIVGGAGAIGAVTARRLAERGARIALVHRSHEPDRTQAVIATLPGAGHRVYTASVTDSAALKAAALAVQADMGAASILVNCAGFTQPVPLADLNGLSDELIDSIFQVNWRGVFATIRAFAPQMKTAADSVVINVSSIAATTGQGSNLAYAASKAATDLMTKALAKALSPEVRVVGISPGVVNTGFVPGRGPEFNQKAAATTPLRRVGEAEDVAQAIVALSTSLAFSTGITLVVDGGRHLVA
jgi:3-oxoacyl-[acyl-carrier protein] reductase